MPIDQTADWLDDLPLSPGPPDLRMGTRALDIDEWLPVDAHTPGELTLREEILAQNDGLVRLVPGHDGAVEELMALAGIHLGRQFRPTNLPRLEQLAISVPDDVLLLWRDHAHWRLIGGALLFGNRWTIEDKLGRTVANIHAPVDGYDEVLEARVDRFFDKLSPARPVWRRNWFIHDDPTLHQPQSTVNRVISNPDEVGSLWIRSEWQTLRRLAFSGLIVFTVKTQIASMHQLAARPLVAADMVTYLRAASERALHNTDTFGRRDAIIGFLGQ